MSTALRIAHGSFGRVALLDMDYSLVRHAHPHCHVLLKVEGADTQFAVGNQVYPLTDKRAVLVNGWQPHAYVHDASRPRTIILALYIEPQWLKTFRPGWVASATPGFFNQPSGEISPRIRSLSTNLAADMMMWPDRSDAHEAALSELMISVIERFTPRRSRALSISNLNRQVSDWRIRRALQIIHEDAGRITKVDVVARETGLSRAHFFRLFESSIGVPPKVYLDVVRIERAVDALLNRPAKICAIGSELGFAESAHFTRFFRSHAGVGPREFRNVSRLAR